MNRLLPLSRARLPRFEEWPYICESARRVSSTSHPPDSEVLAVLSDVAEWTNTCVGDEYALVAQVGSIEARKASTVGLTTSDERFGFRVVVEVDQQVDPIKFSDAEHCKLTLWLTEFYRLALDESVAPRTVDDWRVIGDRLERTASPISSLIQDACRWASAVAIDQFGLRATLQIDQTEFQMRAIPPFDSTVPARGCWVLETAVSFEQWHAVMGGKSDGDQKQAATPVNWLRAQAFLSQLEAVTPLGFDLPSGALFWNLQRAPGNVRAYQRDYAGGSSSERSALGTWAGTANEWCDELLCNLPPPGLTLIASLSTLAETAFQYDILARIAGAEHCSSYRKITLAQAGIGFRFVIPCVHDRPLKTGRFFEAKYSEQHIFSDSAP